MNRPCHSSAAFWKLNEWKLGKFFKVLQQKMYQMGKKIVLSSNLLLLRQEISLCRDILKGQHVMLIKWENFGAFLS
jgi:hypothetical protein